MKRLCFVTTIVVIMLHFQHAKYIISVNRNETEITADLGVRGEILDML